MIKKIISLSLILIPFITYSQDDLMDMLGSEKDSTSSPEKVSYTFKAIKLINANTIETTKKKTLDFRITHRFGNMGISDGTGRHSLYGLDNATNIRFSLDYGLTDRLMIGIGRSKTQEHIDGNLKFRFLDQKKEGVPISAAYFVNVALSPVATVADNKFENRMSYTHQLIIASKISRGVSLEILPTLVHRNYVANIVNPDNNEILDNNENNLMALGFAGRFKITKRMSFVLDYFLTLSEFKADYNYYDALGIGVEIETGGHVFHINLTNSAGIIENDFIPNTRDFWGDDGYKLGFNISRVFSF